MFMDEYSDEDGFALPTIHPLSLKRIAKMHFLIPLKEGYGLNDEQLIFPDELNINKISKIIREIDGIDTCYGGIGIHGHVAFNEPSANIINSESRRVKLNDYTITINAIRSQVGGNLENFPKYAFTLGMKQILGAKRIRLYCRNGSPYDWANTVLRLALLGKPGDDYPVTYIRDHPNYKIITDKDTLKTPSNLI
jgi:glucosamine-6-phosphate deaminase